MSFEALWEEGKGASGRRNVKQNQVGGGVQIGSVDSFTQQAFTESGSCVGHVCPGKVNTVSALLQLIVQWAGEGMEGDGTGSRSQLLKKFS